MTDRDPIRARMWSIASHGDDFSNLYRAVDAVLDLCDEDPPSDLSNPAYGAYELAQWRIRAAIAEALGVTDGA